MQVKHILGNNQTDDSRKKWVEFLLLKHNDVAYVYECVHVDKLDKS